MILDELVAFSNFYGSNEELVLAGGGNTSAKDGDIMYIKGSGTSLSTITADGFVKMSREKLAVIFTKEYPDDDKTREALSLKDLSDARLPGEEGRPSVETTLHSLFKFRFVLHLHPALVNGLCCGKDGSKIAKELFGDDIVWVEPCKPGYILAKICHDLMSEYENKFGKPADILLLANHGVFVADDTVEGLGKKLDKILCAIGERVKKEPDFTTGAFLPDKAQAAADIISKTFPEDYIFGFEPSAESLKRAASPEAAAALLKPFTPDHIVYCKAHPIYAEDENDIPALVENYVKKHGYYPKIVLLKDCGVYAVDANLKGSETASMLFNDALKIACFSEFFGGARFMSDELTDFIVNWEAESYRSKKNA